MSTPNPKTKSRGDYWTRKIGAQIIRDAESRGEYSFYDHNSAPARCVNGSLRTLEQIERSIKGLTRTKREAIRDWTKRYSRSRNQDRARATVSTNKPQPVFAHVGPGNASTVNSGAQTGYPDPSSLPIAAHSTVHSAFMTTSRYSSALTVNSAGYHDSSTKQHSMYFTMNGYIATSDSSYDYQAVRTDAAHGGDFGSVKIDGLADHDHQRVLNLATGPSTHLQLHSITSNRVSSPIPVDRPINSEPATVPIDPRLVYHTTIYGDEVSPATTTDMLPLKSIISQQNSDIHHPSSEAGAHPSASRYDLPSQSHNPNSGHRNEHPTLETDYNIPEFHRPGYRSPYGEEPGF